MALLEINLAPSERDLRWFGVVQLAFFGLLGAIVYRGSGSLVAPAVLWSVGSVLCAVYYGIPPLRRVLFVLWMRAVYPIGWVLSHLLVGLLYFGVVTPVGWLVRRFGRDPMQRAILKDAPTYWDERRRDPGSAKYFRQF